jgi:hypothetical protein
MFSPRQPFLKRVWESANLPPTPFLNTTEIFHLPPKPLPRKDTENEELSMKNKMLDLKTLSLHPFPARSALSAQGVQVCTVLSTLEAHLISRDQGRVLLLLEQELMEDLSLITIERFLRYTLCRRVLLLVNPKRKAEMIERWEQGAAWEDGGKRAAQFSMTPLPQYAQEAQLCIATVFDLQMQSGLDSQHPFFQAFDAVLLYDVPTNPGPGWHQIVEIFAARNTRVIGLSSQMSEEEGELLFEHVIATKGQRMRR